MMWIENIQKLEKAAKNSKEYTNSIELAKRAKIEEFNKVQEEIRKAEKELEAETKMSMDALRSSYPNYFNTTSKWGNTANLPKLSGMSQEEKQFLLIVTRGSTAIFMGNTKLDNCQTKISQLDEAKSKIESNVNEMKKAFHIGEQELKNSGSRKGYDEQKNWVASQNEKLDSAIAYYTTGIHNLKQVSEASDLALLSLPKYLNYDERVKNQVAELDKITEAKVTATTSMNAIQNRTGIFAWFEKRSLANQIAQLEEKRSALTTRMHNEAEEVRLAKTRLARFKEIKMENVYNIKLEENSPKNIVHLHEENTSKKAVSAKDIGEHEFISRHRAVHYVIDGKVQQSMIPTNEKFVTWAKSSIERHDRDHRKNYFDDQKIHKEDCGVIEACSQLQKLNQEILDQFNLKPVSEQKFEQATKSVQKPNVVESTLKATSSNAAPSLNASQTLSPVDSKTIE